MAHIKNHTLQTDESHMKNFSKPSVLEDAEHAQKMKEGKEFERFKQKGIDTLTKAKSQGPLVLRRKRGMREIKKGQNAVSLLQEANASFNFEMNKYNRVFQEA